MENVIVAAKGVLHIVIGYPLIMILVETENYFLKKLASGFSLLFGLFLFFSALPACADTFDIHFFYDVDRGYLSLDPDVKPPVAVSKDAEMSIMAFLQDSSGGDFEIAFLYADGYAAVHRKFSPEKGNFIFHAPYLSLARKLEVYRSGSSEPLFSYDLSEFSTCNKNGICEYEKGENLNTCLPDCVGVSVNFSEETKRLLAQNGDILKDPKTGEVLLQGVNPVLRGTGVAPEDVSQGVSVVAVVIFGVAFLLIVGGVLMLFLLKRRNRRYGL